jgi:hypothetical protein
MKTGSSRRLSDWAYYSSAIILATVLLGMTCALAVRFDYSFLFQGARLGLSERTVSTLESLSGNVSCTVILPRNNEIYPPLRKMLFDFGEAVSNATLRLLFLDPHSDLAQSADAVRRYGATGWSVIFDNGNRFEIVPYEALVEKSSVDSSPSRQVITRFHGQQVCVTALAKLARPKSPVVYALSGHGERDFASYDALTGYSDFARELFREGYVLHTLRTVDAGIPADCDLLVIAGPRFAPGQIEETAIAEYLGRGGRLLLLADRSDSIPNGWENLLSLIGLKFANYTAIGADTLGGYNLLSDNFGNHPVTKYLSRSAVYFVNPQVIDPVLPEAEMPAPQVTVVASAPEKAWGESNPDVLPRHYDPDVDRKGALPLILAVEGPGSAGNGLSPFRAFVIGDSNFAANSLIEGGTTANRDLLLNAVSWLTELGGSTEPSAANEGAALRLAISRNRQIRFWIRSVVVWPLAAILLGALMSVVRRLTT